MLSNCYYRSRIVLAAGSRTRATGGIITGPKKKDKNNDDDRNVKIAKPRRKCTRT